MAFTIKRNDLLPIYRAQLLQGDPETGDSLPVDLTEADSVKFIMSLASGGTGVAKVSSPATIDDPANGIVSYTWTGSDTSLEGTFNVEFEVLFATKPQTFPADGYLTVKVVADLG
jgi:hypothetical protein